MRTKNIINAILLSLCFSICFTLNTHGMQNLQNQPDINYDTGSYFQNLLTYDTVTFDATPFLISDKDSQRLDAVFLLRI